MFLASFVAIPFHQIDIWRPTTVPYQLSAAASAKVAASTDPPPKIPSESDPNILQPLPNKDTTNAHEGRVEIAVLSVPLCT